MTNQIIFILRTYRATYYKSILHVRPRRLFYTLDRSLGLADRSRDARVCGPGYGAALHSIIHGSCEYWTYRTAQATARYTATGLKRTVWYSVRYRCAGRALYRTVRSLNPIYAIVAAYNGNKALAVQVVAARRY